MIRLTGRWLAVSAAVAAASYAAYVATTWLRYGHVVQTPEIDRDELLDTFMPAYEVVERHRISIAAPAVTAFEAATEMDLEQSPIVRGIFKAREWIMGSHPVLVPRRRSFISQMQAIGWGVLAEVPGRELVMGAVTQPWMADVVFRPLPPEEFAAFHEPDYVKIVWTLRADPIALFKSVFRTETRVATTDSIARAKFRQYWSFVSPGVILIRWMLLGPLKADAERRARRTASPSSCS